MKCLIGRHSRAYVLLSWGYKNVEHMRIYFLRKLLKLEFVRICSWHFLKKKKIRIKKCQTILNETNILTIPASGNFQSPFFSPAELYGSPFQLKTTPMLFFYFKICKIVFLLEVIMRSETLLLKHWIIIANIIFIMIHKKSNDQSTSNLTSKI